jgi:hypothetical protein
VPSGLLYVLKLRPVFERRRNEGGPHRVRRVAAIEPDLAGIFPDHGVDSNGVHAAAFVPAFAIVVQRPEQGPVDIAAEWPARSNKPASVLPSAG